MGGTSWSDASYKSYSSKVASASTDAIFTNNISKAISSDMNPKDVVVRESRDSVAHPQAQGVIVALDVTGSMGSIPEKMVKETLPNLMKTLIDNGLPDVQIMFIAVGDHISDRAPLQIGQFESGTEELIKWLTSTYLEGNGGGQERESYSLAWLVGSKMTALDCFEKRGQKGLIFTIGDEGFHTKIDMASQSKIFGRNFEADLDSIDLLRSAEKTYDVFHLHCNTTQYRDDVRVINPWRDALGERLLIVEDTTKIPEIIATTIGVMNQVSLDKMTSGFDSSTALVVRNALANVKAGKDIANPKSGVGVL